MYYLGIDGGGTKTVAAVSDEKGKILLMQEGKSINFYSVGMESARFNLKTLLTEIDATLCINKFESAFIGCSALDGEADEKLTAELCDGIVNAKSIKMHSDVYIALKSVKDAEYPCVAICGTGSIAAAEDNDGSINVSGGWGHILGDEGSAYSIAVSALRICSHKRDKGEKTPLLECANKFFGVTDFRKAIDIIYSYDMTKDRLARFAEALDMNDETIRRIIIIEAQKFAFTVQTLLKKVKKCDILGLYGGVFQHNSLFREEFTESIKNEFPEIKIQLIETPPAETAAELARGL